MMYNNKLAIAVKSNGKVLREFKDTAFIPFGSEYSLLIKNLNTVRVQVRVDIDGTDATEGATLIIAPNSEMELTRFIKNGNLKEGNAFKFIERTAGVEKHRGVGVEDGLIRVEYQFEQLPIPTIWPTERWVKKQTEVWVKEYDQFRDCYGARSIGDVQLKSSGILRGMSGTMGVAQNAAVNQAFASSASYSTTDAPPTLSTTATSTSFNDAGITVPGSVSDQQFKLVSSFPVESTKHVMVIKLLGETEGGQPIVAPVTVKAKPKCTTCGHVNKAKSKFCSECGTSLTIV